MNINASIIDQRLESVVNNIRQKAAEELRIRDDSRLKSLAFVYLCVKTILDLDEDAVFDCLTEGGGDFEVDERFNPRGLGGDIAAARRGREGFREAADAHNPIEPIEGGEARGGVGLEIGKNIVFGNGEIGGFGEF